MAVEWLRSCYESEWHLFADAPSVTTPGRYYFCPESAPFYPGVHNLFSRNWTDGNNGVLQGLGEDISTPQSWYNGSPPPVIPNNDLVGSSLCIEQGEYLAEGIGGEALRNGFVEQCWIPTPPLEPTWDTASSFSSCSIQLFYASVIQWSYAGDEASITTAFDMLLGNGVLQILFQPATLLLPGVTVVRTTSGTIIVVDGTVNFQQFATQAFLAILPPQDFGGASTSPNWYVASDWVLTAAESIGLTADEPVFLVGHSYGGVSATVLAARLRMASPHRAIRYLTYGDPKPGDQRLYDTLATVPGLSLANVDDLVTVLPPFALDLWPLVVALGLPGLRVWDAWIREPNRGTMDEVGNITYNFLPPIPYDTLLAFTVRALAHQQLDVITPHFISIYADRIRLRCPQTEWPVSPALYAFLTGAPPLPTSYTSALPGSGSWLCPVGITSATIELWGAGATGLPNSGFAGGTGGGGGAYSRSVLPVTPGTVYLYYIGIGFMGFPASNGQTWFGSTATAKADCGGHRNAIFNPRPGLTAFSVGSVIFDGGWGSTPPATKSGGGGSSAGTAGAGLPASLGSGSAGGIAPAGGGNGGDGGEAAGVGPPPLPGQVPGGGGAGGATTGILIPGANGMIRISW